MKRAASEISRETGGAAGAAAAAPATPGEPTLVRSVDEARAVFRRAPLNAPALFLDFDHTLTKVHLWHELQRRGYEVDNLESVTALIDVILPAEHVRALAAMLERLQRDGVRVFVLSNNYATVIAHALRTVGLARYFDAIMGRAVTHAKDKTDVMRAYLHENGAHYDQVAFADDTDMERLVATRVLGKHGTFVCCTALTNGLTAEHRDAIVAFFAAQQPPAPPASVKAIKAAEAAEEAKKARVAKAIEAARKQRLAAAAVEVAKLEAEAEAAERERIAAMARPPQLSWERQVQRQEAERARWHGGVPPPPLWERQTEQEKAAEAAAAAARPPLSAEEREERRRALHEPRWIGGARPLPLYEQRTEQEIAQEKVQAEADERERIAAAQSNWVEREIQRREAERARWPGGVKPLDPALAQWYEQHEAQRKADEEFMRSIYGPGARGEGALDAHFAHTAPPPPTSWRSEYDPHRRFAFARLDGGGNERFVATDRRDGRVYELYVVRGYDARDAANAERIEAALCRTRAAAPHLAEFQHRGRAAALMAL